jgi:hypothetical protein
VSTGFFFAGPLGPVGPAGPQGPQGIQGVVGPSGSIAPNTYLAASYGVVADGVTDDRPAWEKAIIAVDQIGGGIILAPSGTSTLSQSGSANWCLNFQGNNIVIQGLPGLSWWKAPINSTANPVALVYLNGQSNIEIKGMGFDGNWGNFTCTVESGSYLAQLPTGTIFVDNNSLFPTTGSFFVKSTAFPETQQITYTGTSPGQFTGCTGGTGSIRQGAKIVQFNDDHGHNQGTQPAGDASSHTLMMRGVNNVLIRDCQFRRAYGDFVWMGVSVSPAWNAGTATTNVRIEDCDGETAARDGFDIAQSCDGITITNCHLQNIWAQAMDSEPVVGFARNVTLNNCLLDSWYCPSTHNPAPLSIVGSYTVDSTAQQTAQNWRVENCTIHGATLIESAANVVFRGNTIIQDWDLSGSAAIFAQFVCEDLTIEDNWFYCRALASPVADGSAQDSVIMLYNFLGAVGGTSAAPARGVRIRNNKIHAKNGRYGIKLNAPGGASVYITGTVQAATYNTMVISGSGPLVQDQYAWTRVRVGTAIASVTNNDVSGTLSLGFVVSGTTTSWVNTMGVEQPTPTVGSSFVMYRSAGLVEVEDNSIYMGDDGYGQGSYGIYVYPGGNKAPGSRLRISRNQIFQASGSAINVVLQANTTSSYQYLELTDNFALDDQAIPTCQNVINIVGTAVNQNVNQLVIRGNTASTGITNVLSGSVSGTWQIAQGNEQQWAGFGNPNGQVSASIGATYQRLWPIGTAAVQNTFYVKESGSYNSGWTAK